MRKLHLRKIANVSDLSVGGSFPQAIAEAGVISFTGNRGFFHCSYDRLGFLPLVSASPLSRCRLARLDLSLPTCLHLSPSRACWAGCNVTRCPDLLPHATTRLPGWAQDGLARSAPHLFSHALAGLHVFTRWSGLVSSLSPHVFPFVPLLASSRACRARCCHEMVWLSQVFCFLLPHMLAGWSAGCLPASFLTHVWLVSPLVSLRA